MQLLLQRKIVDADAIVIAFREVRNAAPLLRELLDALDLAAWVKTSGGRGLHVIVPVSGTVSYADVQLVAETVVKRAIRREPTLFSRDARPARRRGRILIDTSRNDRGSSIIVPYGVATSGLVSALVDWDELRRPLYPDDFDIDRVLAREETDREIAAAFFAADQSLDAIVRASHSGRSRRGGRWLLGDTPAVVCDEAQQLRAESLRLRDDAEVTRIESTDVRHRARKVRDARVRPAHPAPAELG